MSFLVSHSFSTHTGEGITQEQAPDLLRAAKLDAWRINNCPLDIATLGRGTWGLLHNAAIKVDR